MTYRKEIRYDHETRHYAYYLDGNLIGFARNYHEADVELDGLVYSLLCDQPAVTTETAPDPTEDMYRVLCLIVSGTAAATAISEARRVIARYEAEHNA